MKISFARADGGDDDEDYLRLLNQPDREWITIQLSLTGLDRCNDHEDQIQQVKNNQQRQQEQANEQETGSQNHDIIYEHRDLEVERLFPVFIYLRRLLALEKPNNQRGKDMSDFWCDKTDQCARMTKHSPRPHI